MDFEVVAEGLGFPEGPIAMPDGSVIFVELFGGRLWRAWGNNKKEVISEVGAAPAGAAIGPDGAVYITNCGELDKEKFKNLPGPAYGGHIQRVDLATGRCERLYDSCNGNVLSAPDDLVFDATGNIWFTNIGRGFERSREYGGLYYCSPDGRMIVEAHYGGLSYNGIGLLPGEQSVVVADMITARLLKFDLDGPGKIKAAAPGSRTPAQLVATVPGDCELDSLAVLASGAVVIGTLFQGGLTTVRPNGDVEQLRIPDTYVTNIAFGGDDMQTAFVTLSQSGRVVKMRWPEPGLRLNFGY
jgi:gluconolactonase